MSKLFETLEAIKRHDSTGFPRTDHSRRIAPVHRPVKLGLLLALLCFVLLGGGLYYAMFRPEVRPGGKLSPVAEQKSGQPFKHPASAVSSPSDRASELVEANNAAVAHIRNRDHWRGVYLLTSLVERYPGRVEPLINLGVALAEVGLWEPAQEYLSRARALDPRHPLLVKNITILRQAGLFDEFSRPRFEEGNERYE